MNFLLSMLAGVPGNFLYLYLPDRIGRISTLLVVELTLGSVMRVGSDTFGDPIFQKALQN